MRIFIIYLFFLSAALSAQISNITVSVPEVTNPNEVSIAINPLNPDNIVIGSNLNYYYYSFDGGANWNWGVLTSSMGVWGDPSLAFDMEGNLYYAHLSGEPPLSGNWVDRIIIQKSTDGGISWNDGTYTGLNRPKHEDKEWITIDYTGSQYDGNLYVGWTEFDQVFSSNPADKSRVLFSRSTDKGITWSEPLQLCEVEGDCLDDDNTTEGAVPAVGPEGQIYIAWTGPEGIVFDKSTDGGLTFGDDKFITDHVGGWGWGYEVPGIYGNGLPQTFCNISDSPWNGDIYILWADQRNGIYNTDIFLIKSDDEGESWGNIVRVNNDETDRPQFYPWLAIDKSNGWLYIVFYDRRNTEYNYTDVYLARSTDGGETFDNFLISEESFNARKQNFIGDYISIASENEYIYPVWTHSISASENEIRMAKFTDDELLTNVEPEVFSAGNFELMQNYPNPFNPSTTINFKMKTRGHVLIEIFNVNGEKVGTLLDRNLSAGYYSADWHAKNKSGDFYPSGIYICSMKSEGYEKAIKMMLLK